MSYFDYIIKTLHLLHKNGGELTSAIFVYFIVILKPYEEVFRIYHCTVGIT